MSLTKVTSTMIVGASLDPQDYGAVSGAGADKAANSVAIQACVDAAIAQGVGIHFTGGIYQISTAITISSSITITADNDLGILCFGCDGFVIQAGVQSVTIDGVYIAHSPGYTTTTNTYSGIKINATGSPTSSYNCFRNLFINGFKYGIYAKYTWATNFEGLKILSCDTGILGSGLCVNNTVSNCQIVNCVSSGVQVGDGTAAAEGWMIQNNLIYGSNYGVYVNQSSNNNITNNVIDAISNTGVLLFGESDPAGYGSTNCTITDNYIAGDAMSNGIRCKNDYAPAVVQYRGNYIAGNQILGYTTLANGIIVDGAYERKNIITGNRTVNKGGAGYDCVITQGTDHIVANNVWQGLGFYCTVPVIYSNNAGTILATSPNLFTTLFGNKVQQSTVVPTTGTWTQGDIVWNSAPASGAPPGWVCVTSGTLPSTGAFKAMANLA